MKLFKTKKTNDYYDYSEIDKTNAVYRLIIGVRSNGKTYGAIKKAITAFFTTGKPSAYVRRYAEDIKSQNISMLLDPHKDLIKKLSKGKYNDYTYKMNTFNFVLRDNKGTIKNKSEDFMYLVSLNSWEHGKGSDKASNGLAYLIFDEFLTRGRYLTNEFATFANVISSFIRNRPGTIIYMLANTVSQYGNPYFVEMGLNKVDTLKQGDIQLYTYNNDKLTVAIEYCYTTNKLTDVEHYYAFDSPSLSILTNGDWESDAYPHWDNKDLFIKTPYTEKFRVFLQFQGHIAVGEVHKKDDNYCVFWHPYGMSKTEITEKDILYTDLYTAHKKWSNFLFTNQTKKHMIITNLMKHQKDFYSDNTTGELIRSFILWDGGRKIK